MRFVGQNLYRGPRPASLKELRGLGISRVISLQSGVHEFFNDDARERDYPHEFNIKYYPITMSDITPPKPEDVEEVLRIIAEAKEVNELVYIHCLHGKDRTGFCCAVFKMRVMGESYADAKADLFKHGFHKIPYLLWLPSLKKYATK